MCLRRICLAAVLVVTAVEPTFALTCSGRGNGYLYNNVGRFPGTMLVLGRITVEEEVDDVPDELDEDPRPLRAQERSPGPSKEMRSPERPSTCPSSRPST